MRTSTPQMAIAQKRDQNSLRLIDPRLTAMIVATTPIATKAVATACGIQSAELHLGAIVVEVPVTTSLQPVDRRSIATSITPPMIVNASAIEAATVSFVRCPLLTRTAVP